MGKLSATELLYMDIIWKQREEISSADLYANFPQALSTKSTILNRIVKKGWVRCIRKGKQTYYQALKTRREYEKEMMQQEIQKHLGYSSFQALFAAFCGRKELTGEEKERLEKLMEEIEMGAAE